MNWKKKRDGGEVDDCTSYPNGTWRRTEGKQVGDNVAMATNVVATRFLLWGLGLLSAALFSPHPFNPTFFFFFLSFFFFFLFFFWFVFFLVEFFRCFVLEFIIPVAARNLGYIAMSCFDWIDSISYVFHSLQLIMIEIFHWIVIMHWLAANDFVSLLGDH